MPIALSTSLGTRRFSVRFRSIQELGIGLPIRRSRRTTTAGPEGLGPITSYRTFHVYALEGAPSRPAVIQWYRSRLGARCRFSGGSGHGDGRYYDASFHCGSGSIFIAPSEDSLLISADYNGYGR